MPAVLLLVALATGCASAGEAPARPSLVTPVELTAAQPPPRPARVDPIEILRSWDTRRAAAWARGDPRGLRRLYTPGSVAGRRDLAMLRAWVARGLVVRGLHTQLLAVRVRGHTGSTWTLLVTDRLAGGVAAGASVRRPLPRDQATTRIVRLRRVHGIWRVEAVLPA
jgi:hypothetical protein